MASGGKRINAGRKPKADEDQSRGLSLAAIERRFGTHEAGFEWLLDSGEATLIKFVFEHAFGKPTEKVQMENLNPAPVIIQWPEDD